MRKFLMAIVAVLVLASCAGNVFEQKTEVYTEAKAKVAVAKTADELEGIVNTVKDEIKAIEDGEEWKAYEVLVENNDTAALKEYKAAKTACDKAKSEFAVSRLDAALKLE